MDVGAELRTAREGKNLSLDAVSQRTRVPQRALAAIERNDLSAIPPRPFGRGFVRAYAAEVGLNGEHMAREYFAQFPPSPEPPPTSERVIDPDPESRFDLSSQWAGLITATVLLVLVVAAAASIGRGRAPKSEPDAVGTVGATPATAAKDDAKGTAVTPAASVSKPVAAPATPAQTTPLKLDFTVTRPCWVAATADGQQTIYRILQAGESQSLSASREIKIRFGDVDAVTWTLNGRKGDSLGAAGVVRDLVITPENAPSIR